MLHARVLSLTFLVVSAKSWLCNPKQPKQVTETNVWVRNSNIKLRHHSEKNSYIYIAQTMSKKRSKNKGLPKKISGKTLKPALVRLPMDRC